MLTLNLSVKCQMFNMQYNVFETQDFFEGHSVSAANFAHSVFYRFMISGFTFYTAQSPTNNGANASTCLALVLCIHTCQQVIFSIGWLTFLHFKTEPEKN